MCFGWEKCFQLAAVVREPKVVLVKLRKHHWVEILKNLTNFDYNLNTFLTLISYFLRFGCLL